MSFQARFLWSIGLLLGAVSSAAQAQSSPPWQTTRLDSVASVRMPYAGTFNDEFITSGLIVFATNTSDNEFDAFVFNPVPDSAHPLKPGQLLLPDVDQFISLIMRLPDKSFARAKLKTSFPVTITSAPGGKAMHQVYNGFDAFHQTPAVLELTWVMVGTTLYVFRCSYPMPQEKGAAEDAQHFFRSIVFKPSHP